jgi:hypothetical protein
MHGGTVVRFTDGEALSATARCMEALESIRNMVGYWCSRKESGR